MRIKFYILILISFTNLASFGQTPDWLWAKSAGGFYDDIGFSVSTDEYGNALITGTFCSSPITFDTITLYNNTGDMDIFLAKYNSSGDIIWAKSASGIYDDYAFDVCTDTQNNVFITGMFTSPTITFGSITLNNNYGGGQGDFFVVKYDQNGNVLWAKCAGGDSDDWGNSINCDISGNVYITGNFFSFPITFGSFTLSNMGTFIVKYDQNGSVLWAKCTGGNIGNGGTGNSICVDSSNNIYIAGWFGSSIVFDTDTLFNPNTLYKDLYIVKCNSNGNVLWAKKADGNLDNSDQSITSDKEDNIYLTGNFLSPTFTFDSIVLTNTITDTSDIFLAKYDSSGNTLWAKSVGGNDQDISSGICTDTSSNVFITGTFRSPVISFDTVTLVNNGYNNIFLAKYNKNGQILWAKNVGGGYDDWSYDTNADLLGNIFITGWFGSSVIQFGSSLLANNGITDIYIAKIGTDEIVNIEGVLDNDLISLFPNPTSHDFTLTFPPGARQIVIMNSLGQIVQSTLVDKQTNLNYTLNYTGLYFIQITTDKKTVTKKIIVTN